MSKLCEPIKGAIATTDQIMERICEALNKGMNRFEQRGEAYGSIVEKHRDAVNETMYGGGNQRGNRFRAEGKLK